MNKTNSSQNSSYLLLAVLPTRCWRRVGQPCAAGRFAFFRLEKLNARFGRPRV